MRILVGSLALVSVSVASPHGTTASSSTETAPTSTSTESSPATSAASVSAAATTTTAATGALGFGRFTAVALVSPGKVLVAAIRTDPVAFAFLATTTAAAATTTSEATTAAASAATTRAAISAVTVAVAAAIAAVTISETSTAAAAASSSVESAPLAALVLPGVVPLGQRNLDQRTVKVLVVEPTDRRLGRVRVLVRDGGLALRTARFLVLVDPNLGLHRALVLLNDADGAKVVGNFRLGRFRVHALHEDGVLLRDHLSITFAIITTLVAGATAVATALVTTSSAASTAGSVTVASTLSAVAATVTATAGFVIILPSVATSSALATVASCAATSTTTAAGRWRLAKVGLRDRRRGNGKVHSGTVATTVILRSVSGVLVGHR